eukprot:gene27939-33738_t
MSGNAERDTFWSPSDGKGVTIHGLQSKSELNGYSGEVVEVLSNGRVKVKLIGNPLSPSILVAAATPHISVKPENLRPIRRHGEAASLRSDSDPDPDNNGGLFRDFSVPSFSPVRTIWWNSGYFYPFGNTNAKRLTAYIPPEQDTATILLLGCGDFRHILFTSWCHEKAGGMVANQRHNIVACDILPSILARNLVLLRMVYDQADFAKAWMIFYSKFLDSECLELLSSTASSLLLSAGDAPSLTNWNSSAFGSIFTFVNEDSLLSVCKQWKAYAQPILPHSAADVSVKRHGEGHRDPTVTYTSSVMHSEPVGVLALQNTIKYNQYTEDYVNGVVDVFRSVYQLPSGSKESMLSNPMMIEGSNSLELHYNLDPPSGFHPSLCYGPLHNTSAVLPGLVHKNPAEFHSDLLTTNSFAEFAAWCAATKVRMDRTLFRLFLYVGNAFDLLFALTARRYAMVGTVNTTAGQLQMPADLPVEFDIIDSNNLADHCGLLNVLLTCKPLLASSPHSTLLTENMSSFTTATSFSLILERWLGTSVPTFAAMTSIVLMDYPSSTVCSLKAQLMAKEVMSMRSCTILHLRWRVFAQSNMLSMSPEDFVELFYGIYMRMFKSVIDQMSSTINTLSMMKNIHAKEAGKILEANHYIHTTAHTFALLLKTALQRIDTASSPAVAQLYNRIGNSGLMFQGHVCQELIAWLAHYQVVSRQFLHEFVDTNLVLVRSPSQRSTSDSAMYMITLLVPKEALDSALGDVPTPLLEFNVGNERYENNFANVFIQCLSSHPGSAWSFDSLPPFCTDMQSATVVAFTALVPFSCLGSPDSTCVELRLPASMMLKCLNLRSRLGLKLAVYSARLLDTRQVARKSVEYGSNPICRAYQSPVSTTTASASRVSSIVWSTSTNTLTAKIDFSNTSLQNATPVLKQRSHPCAVSLEVLGQSVDVTFPIPIDANRTKLQISRSKGYINLLAVPLSLQSVPDRFVHLFNTGDQKLQLYGTSYIPLDALFEVQTAPSSELTKWLLTLIGVSMSASEREIQRSNTNKTAMLAWKESLHEMVRVLSPEKGRPLRHLTLRSKERGGRSLCTVATWYMRKDMNSRVEICTTAEEMKLWKRMLPGLIEMTRTSWQHLPTCEYLRNGRIPLCDDGNGQKVVCSCALGKQLANTLFEEELKKTNEMHLVKYFARAAIPFIFSLG